MTVVNPAHAAAKGYDEAAAAELYGIETTGNGAGIICSPGFCHPGHMVFVTLAMYSVIALTNAWCPAF
jgi:hypothetical protein